MVHGSFWVAVSSCGRVLKSPAFHGSSKTADTGLEVVEQCPLCAWEVFTQQLARLIHKSVQPRVVCCLPLFRPPACSHIPLETSACVDRRSWWACSAKGRRTLVGRIVGVFVATWWRRWSPLLMALRGQSQGRNLLPQGWQSDASEDRKLVNRHGTQAAGDRTQGVVKRRVQFVVVGAPAPDGGAVLSGGEDQCLGRDAEHLGRGAPGCIGESAYQSDAGGEDQCLGRDAERLGRGAPGCIS